MFQRLAKRSENPEGLASALEQTQFRLSKELTRDDSGVAVRRRPKGTLFCHVLPEAEAIASFTTLSSIEYKMPVNITLPPTSQLSGPEDDEIESSSEGTQEEEETFSDWVDEDAAPTQSLFDDYTHPNALAAVAHDKQAHGVDIVELGTILSEPLPFILVTDIVTFCRA